MVAQAANIIDLDSCRTQPVGHQLRRTRLALCARLLAMRTERRFEEMMPFLTPDCELHVGGGAAAAPVAGTYVGRDAIIALFRRCYDLFDHDLISHSGFILDGDCVGATWRARMRGSEAIIRGVTHFRFEGERLSAYHSFFDRDSGDTHDAETP